MLEAAVHEVEHATQVHVDGIGERLRRQARGQRTDAGVGDHDVKTAQLGNAAVDRRGQRCPVAHVRDLGERTLTLLLDEPRGLVEVLGPGQWVFVGFDVFAQVHRDDVGTLGGEHPRVRAPLTARGSADHRHLARDPAHRRSFLRPSTKTNYVDIPTYS